MDELKKYIPYLSEAWKEKYSKILQEEHLESIEGNIALFKSDPTLFDQPHFNEEIKEDLDISFNYFFEIETLINNQHDSKYIAQKLEQIPFEQWLLVLGQRLTSASERDEKAIPPLQENFIASCLVLYNSEITVAQRAWEKHIDRLEDEFWGKIKGNNQLKQEKMMEKIRYIINHKTWWNIFFHYKHGLVYEIREKGGHGIRWNAEGSQLIGFLEPFINE
ncbi:hypothetical protein SAMN05444267_102611 [Chryseobacterium polytrichastri]|uniref:Uncharacterized protein n=2 Tax=Chryseobacterium polytrichastri TaxID=1302687 RepID=A0A1M7DVN4_9FLAO|nr:hypothetical protein SAMN05444267_102611 [Chryseobacterium polytrichastri]